MESKLTKELKGGEMDDSEINREEMRKMGHKMQG